MVPGAQKKSKHLLRSSQNVMHVYAYDVVDERGMQGIGTISVAQR